NKAPLSLNRARILADLGMLYTMECQPEKALTQYKEAADIIEKQRKGIGGIEERRLLVEANTKVFMALFRTYLTLPNEEEAFNTVERIRGRSQADSLSNHPNNAFKKDVPPGLLKRQDELDNERSIVLKERLRLDLKDEKGVGQNDVKLQDINVRQRQLE